MYAAEKAAAKQEGEHTRKKLMEVASKLAGQSESGEASIVEIGAREESRDESSRQGRQDTDEPQKPNGETTHMTPRDLCRTGRNLIWNWPYPRVTS